jgi:orotate phosphoribosyltransferase-like protein
MKRTLNPEANLAKRGRKPNLERRKQAREMRRQGMTFQQIGDRLGVSHQAAWQLVNGRLGERRQKK